MVFSFYFSHYSSLMAYSLIYSCPTFEITIMAHGNLTYVLVLSVIILHDLHQKFGQLSFVTAQQSGPCYETAFLTLVKSVISDLKLTSHLQHKYFLQNLLEFYIDPCPLFKQLSNRCRSYIDLKSQYEVWTYIILPFIHWFPLSLSTGANWAIISPFVPFYVYLIQ